MRSIDDLEKIFLGMISANWVKRITERHGEALVWTIAENVCHLPLEEAIKQGLEIFGTLTQQLDALSVDNLQEIEPLHEDILSNMIQGTTESTLAKRLKRTEKMSLLEDMQDFLKDKISLGKQLKIIRDKIENGHELVRKVGKGEADVYLDKYKWNNLTEVFLRGKEGMKAFAIDKKYKFKDVQRNKKEGDYDYTLVIPLTRMLKDYLLKYIYANVASLLSITFSNNPQFKFEQDDFTILISRGAWIYFWSRVSHFTIIDNQTGFTYEKLKEAIARQWDEEHEEKLRAFHMISPGESSKPKKDYSSSYIS